MLRWRGGRPSQVEVDISDRDRVEESRCFPSICRTSSRAGVPWLYPPERPAGTSASIALASFDPMRAASDPLVTLVAIQSDAAE